jgi:nicotinamide-nucleotide amidase
LQVKTAQIVAIGTELLLGHVVNTNTSYIAEKLSDLGISLYRTSVVGDNEARIVEELNDAWGKNDLIITTGGLGPTGDDVTRHAVAKFLAVDLVKNLQEEEKIRDFFYKRKTKITDNNFVQALFPEGSELLVNAQGTASGFLIERAGKIIISLPGPPDEVRGIFKGVLDDRLRRLTIDGRRIISRTLKFWGLGESRVDDSLSDLFNAYKNPSLAYLFNRGEVFVRITALVHEDDTTIVREMDAIEGKILRRLGEYYFAKDAQTVDSIVASLLAKKKMRLALAESCTGGMLGQRITSHAGSSDYFDGSLVTYSNQMKVNLLGVSSEMINQYGAVSKECAEAMARGVISTTGCDVSVAITGIAGPEGGTADKPVGLVFIAIANKHEVQVHHLNFLGGRDKVRQLAVVAALHLLCAFLENDSTCEKKN